MKKKNKEPREPPIITSDFDSKLFIQLPCGKKIQKIYITKLGFEQLVKKGIPQEIINRIKRKQEK